VSSRGSRKTWVHQVGRRFGANRHHCHCITQASSGLDWQWLSTCVIQAANHVAWYMNRNGPMVLLQSDMCRSDCKWENTAESLTFFFWRKKNDRSSEHSLRRGELHPRGSANLICAESLTWNTMFIFVVPLNDTILYCTNVVSCYTSSIKFFLKILALETWLQCINNLGQSKPRLTFQKEKKDRACAAAP
jgi:hypothetical protein